MMKVQMLIRSVHVVLFQVSLVLELELQIDLFVFVKILLLIDCG